MEKCKYAYRFGKYIYVILVIMLVCVIPFVIFSILRLAEAGQLTSYYPALDIVSVVFSLLILAFYMTSIFATKYYVDDNYFRLRGTVIHFKLATNDILRLIEENSLLVLYYSLDNVNVDFLVINVKDEDKPSIISELRKSNPTIIYEKAEDKNGQTFDSNK